VRMRRGNGAPDGSAKLAVTVVTDGRAGRIGRDFAGKVLGGLDGLPAFRTGRRPGAQEPGLR
jgi:hypothetical protein